LMKMTKMSPCAFFLPLCAASLDSRSVYYSCECGHRLKTWTSPCCRSVLAAGARHARLSGFDCGFGFGFASASSVAFRLLVPRLLFSSFSPRARAPPALSACSRRPCLASPSPASPSPCWWRWTYRWRRCCCRRAPARRAPCRWR
jgi:hypothetical protein